MNLAIESMENLKSYGEQSTNDLQFQVQTLRSENSKLRASLQENIREELSYLQVAICNAEQQMNEIRYENDALKQNMNLKNKLMKEIENDNEGLINQLRQNETELLNLRSRADLVDKEFGFATITEKDNDIKQLKTNLDLANNEKNKAIRDLKETKNYLQDLEKRLTDASNELEAANRELDSANSELSLRNDELSARERITVSEYENEIKRLEKKLQKANEEKEIALTGQNEKKIELKCLENKLQDLSKRVSEPVAITRSFEYSSLSEKSSQGSNKENGNLTEELMYKDKTIDYLRENLDSLASEMQKYIQNGERNGAEDMKSNEILCQQLSNIQSSLDKSHQELIDEIIKLENEVKWLRKLDTIGPKQNNPDAQKSSFHAEQNYDASDHLSSQRPEGEFSLLKDYQNMKRENKDLRLENFNLREALESSYPGLVERIVNFGKEKAALQDENELLRSACSKDKLELVDSNLRKRDRILRLEKELEDLTLQPPPYRLSKRRRSSSEGEVEQILGESNGQSIHEKKLQRFKESNEVLNEMLNQNDVILKLQEQNEKYSNEISLLKKEKAELESATKTNQLVENELKYLRNAFDRFGADSNIMIYQNQVKELEKEILRLKTEGKNKDKSYDIEDGVSLDKTSFSVPTTPYNENIESKGFKDQIYTRLQKEINRLTKQNDNLQKELDTANNNLFRLAKIIDREQKSLTNQIDKNQMKKLENKVLKMEDENNKLKFSLNNAQNEISESSNELESLKQEAEDLRGKIKHLSVENNRLDQFLKKDRIKADKEKEIYDTINDFKTTINNLENENKTLKHQLDDWKKVNNQYLSQLKEKETLHDELKTIKMENENLSRDFNDLNKKYERVKSEKEDVNEQNKKLQNELEIIRSEINETHFLEWLEKDVDRRVALLSPDSQVDTNLDDLDKKEMRNAARVIRKLQIENQILRGKLLNLEGESVAVIKIVADMERGHGHLTGALRCHLVLQKNTTAKLLEGSLQQYTSDFENFKKKFQALVEKNDRKKKLSKRGDYAWDLFTNAAATISNIHTILNEGLIKVEEDLERDLSDEDFKNKDYKSRLWILRRRLSDVENRHRELQLRAEELSIRLDAKQTEFEVTQDELGGTTQALESRDISIERLQIEIDRMKAENEKLNEIITNLRNKQDKLMGGQVKLLNEGILSAEKLSEDNVNKAHMLKDTADDLVQKLNHKEKALDSMTKLYDTSMKELDKAQKRVSVLERKLKEMTDQRDTLQREADRRSKYLGGCRDDHGTIHMLRDDMKQLAKANADLKQDILLKHRQIYNMSKDLHQLKMEKDLKQWERTDKGAKDEATKKMVNDLAELKAEKFLLETKLKDAERRNTKENNFESADKFVEKSFAEKLAAKEKEIEKMKRELTFIKDDGKSKGTEDQNDTVSDSVGSIFDSKSTVIQKLKEENEILQQLVNEKKLNDHYIYEKEIRSYKDEISKQKSNIEELKTEYENSKKEIKSLNSQIKSLHNDQESVAKYHISNNSDVNEIIATKDDEIFNLKTKAENLENELRRLQNLQSRISLHDDTKFQNIYLNNVTAEGEITQQPEAFLDLTSPHESRDGNISRVASHVLAITPRSGVTTDSGNGSNRKTDSLGAESPYDSRVDLPSFDEAQYEEITGFDTLTDLSNMPKLKYGESRKQKPSKIPVSPLKKRHMPTMTLPLESSTKKPPVKSPLSEINQMQQAKKLAGQIEDIQLLLKSTDHYKSQEKVNELLLLIDELQIYRQKIGVTEHETLLTLGSDKLNSVLDYYLFVKSAMTEEQYKQDILELALENESMKQNISKITTAHDTLQNNFYELHNDYMNTKMNHDNLQNSYNKLQSDYKKLNSENNSLKQIDRLSLPDIPSNRSISSRNSDSNIRESDYLALSEKYNIRADENINLKELLETQTRNVSSQESVIKALKRDLKAAKIKYNKEYDIVYQDLKEKKNEIRLLRKDLKDVKTVMTKESKELKVKEQNDVISKKDVIIQGLQHQVAGLEKNLEELREENCQLTEVKEFQNKKNLNGNRRYYESQIENYKIKEKEYEEVLKHAELALEDAKRKLSENKNKSSDLESKLTELEKEKNLEKEVFDDITRELKSVIDKKTEIITKLQVEVRMIKAKNEDEISTLKGQITESEKQCGNYKVLLQKSESTVSELSSLKSELENEINKARSDTEEMKIENLKLSQENELLLSDKFLTVDVSKTDIDATIADSLLPYDQPDNNQGNYGIKENIGREPNDLMENEIDLEVEFEILKGCNEDLEEQLKEVENEKNEYKSKLETRENDYNGLKRDLEKTLGYLRDISTKNNELVEQNNILNNKNHDLNERSIEFEIKIDKLKEEYGNMEISEIYEMQEQLISSVAINEKDQVLIKEMETVIDHLESEIHLKTNQINQKDARVTEINEKMNKLEEELRNKEKEFDKMNPCEEDTRNTFLMKIGNLEQTLKNEKIKFENQLSLKENENKLVNEENIKQKNKIRDLNDKLHLKTNEIIEMQLQIDAIGKWRNKSETITTEQKEDTDSAISEYTDSVSHQIEQLKFDVNTKNSMIKTLQQDLDLQHEQYVGVLNALNKRRDESKLFLAMQDKLQNELQRKEDVIQNLKFKLKSNDLDLSSDNITADTSSSEDTISLLQEFEEDNDNEDKESIIKDQRQGLRLMTAQLSLVRERNSILTSELEKLRQKYLMLEGSYKSLENTNQTITKDNTELTAKIKEIRQFVQDSPNTSFSDETKCVKLQTKLYTAYKELREKSIEIATLKMNMEVKIVENDSLKEQIKKITMKNITEKRMFKKSMAEITEKWNIVDNMPHDMKSLFKEINERNLTEEQLRFELEKLKESLIHKTKECESLNLELTNVVNKLKDVESKLMEEDAFLRKRYVYGSEENSEISEITTVTSQPISTIHDEKPPWEDFRKQNETGNDTFLIDGFAENSMNSNENNSVKNNSNKTYINTIETENQTLNKDLQTKENIEENLRLEIKELKTALAVTKKELEDKKKQILMLEDNMVNIKQRYNDGMSVNIKRPEIVS